MITATGPFVEINARLQRTPVYAVQFEHWPIPFSTDSLAHIVAITGTSDAVDLAFSLDEHKPYDMALPFFALDQSAVGDMFNFEQVEAEAPPPYFPWLRALEGLQSQVYPEEGHSSVGGVSFTLIDVHIPDGDWVTHMVMSGILGEEVRIYAGFEGMSYDDYTLLFTGLVAAVRTAPTLGSYEFTAYSPQSLLNREIFNTAATTLFTPLDATEDAGLHYNGDVGTLGYMPGYVRIDDEILQIGAVSTAAGFADIEARGALGTIGAAHEANAPIREVIRLGPAHPIDILLGIYQNTGPWNSTQVGCGLDPAYIDFPAFEQARQLIGPDYQMEFHMAGPENALQWAEREIFKPLGAYPVMKADGRNSIVVFHAPAAEEQTAALSHDDMVDESGQIRLTWSLARDGSLGRIINAVQFLYDKNPITGEFGASAEFLRQSSVDLYGRFPIVLESAGIRSELPDTFLLMTARAVEILNRYENGAPLIRCTTFLQDQRVEPGDIVGLTSDYLPNPLTHGRGVADALVEVVNRSIRFDDGQIDFEMLWTSFGAQSRDTFNRADVTWTEAEDLNSDGAWVTAATDPEDIQIQDSKLFLGAHGLAQRTAVFGVNQTSQLTFREVMGGGGRSGPAVRTSYGTGAGITLLELAGYAAIYETASNTVSLRYYGPATDPGASQGVGLGLAPATLVNGDILRIEARGINFYVFLNDVLIISATHTGITSAGRPGAISNHSGAASGDGFLWDDWAGGDSGWA